ncbi:MAG: M23 family metallopeptidase [Oscillibacter sp.]|nr:M23 family metallopeptidase [Oscillibacter sp.]MDD7001481.1 M23 family metallopeptidase [Oscillibacter sp.]
MAGSNGRAKRHFFGGTGLYIALFLGVTALAVAGYWTLLPKNTTDTETEEVSSQQELPVREEAPRMPEAKLPQQAAEPEEDVTVMDEATGVEDTVPVMESSEEVTPDAPRLVVAPLVGEEIAAFSVDELRYNETFGDWRTHDGIDIAAEVGTQVLAACSGTVTSVREDDMLGTLVTIAHDSGFETTYANLRSSPGVSEGQYVSAGEVIGAVGSSAIAEISVPAHLHFSVKKDGAPCDPNEFLN